MRELCSENPNRTELKEISELEQFVEKMPGGFFFYLADESEKILYANDITLEIFGCKTFEEFMELTGGSFKGLVHPDDLDAVENSILDQVNTNYSKLDYVEYRITRKDGKIRYVDDYGRLVNTKNFGEVYYVFIRDITEIHEARIENSRRAKVIEGLSADFSSIFLLNLEKDILRPYRLNSKPLEKIFSELNLTSTETLDRQKIFSTYAEKFVFSEDRENFLRESSKEKIAERIKKDSSYTFSYRCLDENHAPIYMEMSVVSIEEKLSPYIITGFREVTDTVRTFGKYVVTGFRDVTKIIQKVQRELEDKMQMQTALEKEKHENEIKSSFLFSISHDIRTPMNSIMGFTELAKRHIHNHELATDYLNKVSESNTHMLALIDDLLEMSRINYGKVEIKSEPCKLSEQIKMVLDMFRLKISEKNISVEENIDLPDKEVFTDTLSFRRIISNLVDNAVKFTSSGGNIKISARQKKVSDSGYARFEFSVADDGEGMSEEFLQKIFKVFAREKTSTQTGYGGTGLGLAITKKLLEILGGTIKVESKKGEGATFTVELPLKFVEHERAEKEISSEPPKEKAAGKYRILLVEDIEINRMLAETVLTESGFLVESVADGSDAVEIIKTKPPMYYDLVLMDIQMPVMNGYEATRMIRNLDREDTKVLPIIALSANAREEDKKMSLDSGMNAHIAKPFDLSHLIFVINQHVERNL